MVEVEISWRGGGREVEGSGADGDQVQLACLTDARLPGSGLAVEGPWTTSERSSMDPNRGRHLGSCLHSTHDHTFHYSNNRASNASPRALHLNTFAHTHGHLDF